MAVKKKMRSKRVRMELAAICFMAKTVRLIRRGESRVSVKRQLNSVNARAGQLRLRYSVRDAAQYRPADWNRTGGLAAFLRAVVCRRTFLFARTIPRCAPCQP